MSLNHGFPMPLSHNLAIPQTNSLYNSENKNKNQSFKSNKVYFKSSRTMIL